MFESTFSSDPSVDKLESDLVHWEAIVSLARANQADLLRRLDVAQVAAADGSRTMADWTAARLDIHHDTARQLVHAAHSLPEHPSIAAALAGGEVTMDRALATMELVASGAPDDLVEAGAGFDLGGVERLAARHRRVTRSDERQVFADRYWASQHSFDQRRARFWGELPGHDLELVEKALQERADALPPTPAEVCDRRPQRMVDALVAMSLDTIDPPFISDPDTQIGIRAPETSQRRPLATVFVDAELAAATDGEAGAELEFGPRVGPDLLDSILCEGTVQVVGVREGRPVTVTDETQAIPPAIRRYVQWRDGRCTIDGCASRHRLQPHHIRHRSHGGNNDPAGLALLCWYHHHVAIHRHGLRLDPTSPPQRRRFLRNHALGPAPP